MAQDPDSELAGAAARADRQHSGDPILPATISADRYDINVHRSDLPEPPTPPEQTVELGPDGEPTLSKPPVEQKPPVKNDARQIRRKIMIGVMSALAAVSITLPIVSSFLAARGQKDVPAQVTTTTTKPVLTIKPLPVRPVISAFVTTPEQCPPSTPAPPNQPTRICDINRTAVYELGPEAMRVQLTNVDSFLNPLTGVQLVQMSMTNESASEFGKFTAGQVGKQVAFVRGGTVVWGPKIGAPIEGQVIQLSGDLTAEQAKKIATMLRDQS